MPECASDVKNMNLDVQQQSYDYYFSHAIELYEALGNSNLPDGKSLCDSLKVVGDVSLWSCLSTYLVLYRLPLCFETKGHLFGDRYRPYVGWLAQLRDRLFSINRFSTEGVKINRPPSPLPTVLMLRFSEAIYQSVLQPVHEKLRSHPDSWKVVSLVNDRRGHTSDSYSILDFCTPAMMSRRAKGINCIKNLTDPILQLSTKEKFYFEGADKIDRVALRRELHWLCTREFPRLVTLAASAYEVIESIRPSLILTGDDADQKCKLFELIGSTYSIPTLVVQQGSTRKDYPDWKYFAGDHAAVMGPSSVETITAQGVPAERLTITGHPGFDQYVNFPVDEVIETRRRLDITAKEIFILFTSQPFLPGAFKTPAIRDAMIKSIVKASNNIPEIKLAIKPHPSDDIVALKRLCEGYNNIIFLDKSCTTSSLIKACDVFVTMFSQTTLEALYANKPVINVNFFESGIKADFLEKGATLIAHTEAEVMEAFKAVAAGDFKFFQSEEQHAAAKMVLCDWTSTPDGRAGDRIIKLIQEKYLNK